ncbi:hypothetical protein H9633_03230 [Microbacterium sp. Re1]|uniref:DUF5667 domain-containing protein n=1 Tax=Microbacterium commune TaxID=2762219 RepID=A0ABR8W2R4_9MICO|nr:hypothetical protein [Microbacterium commune]MBD8011312.1 hypothetical protein [Microbacterium commune]
MSTLDDLFPDGRRQSGADVSADEQQTVRRLDQLLGDRRADIDRTHRASARPALVAMVDGALSDARPLGTVPATSHPDSRRPRRRFDLLNLSVAALAVVALAAAGLIGGVQAATASPATDALRVLAADEKTIESATAGLESARGRLIESVAEADAAAAALRPALESTRSAPDPADIPPGETEAPADAGTIPIADPKALDTVLAALDAYRTDLSAFGVPHLPEPYARGAVDSDSLTEVGAAIDHAQLQLGEIDRVSAQIRVARTSLDDRNAAFAAQLVTFAKTFPDLASAAVDDNGNADEDLRDAVVTAADALTKTDLQTAAGVASLTAYRDAVVALVADQVYADRLREEREREEAERERERQRQWRPNPAPEPTPDATPAPDPEQTERPAESDGSGDVAVD